MCVCVCVCVCNNNDDDEDAEYALVLVTRVKAIYNNSSYDETDEWERCGFEPVSERHSYRHRHNEG